MSTEIIFQTHLALGYIACLLFFNTYMMPKLQSMGRPEAHRVIATIHSFRFFGLVFIVPGVVGSHLPASFANVAAYGDFATGILAILALLAFRIRPLFSFFTVAFNLAGVVDLLVDYYHAVRIGLPAMAGELGSAYVIPIVYVPLLMITHVAAFYLMVRSRGPLAALQRDVAMSR